MASGQTGKLSVECRTEAGGNQDPFTSQSSADGKTWDTLALSADGIEQSAGRTKSAAEDRR